jgi:GAF domain-containing protein
MALLADRGKALAAAQDTIGQLAQRLAHTVRDLQALSLRLTALIELGLELSLERNPARLVEVFCGAAHSICVAKYAAVGVLERDTQGLSHFSGRGLEVAALTDLARWVRPEGILETLLQEHIPHRLAGLDGDPQRIGLPATHPQIHSFLGISIASPTRTYGWLYLADKLGADEFSEVDEEIARTLAAQLAIAYENLSLYEELQRRDAQLRMQVSEGVRADAIERNKLPG